VHLEDVLVFDSSNEIKYLDLIVYITIEKGRLTTRVGHIKLQKQSRQVQRL